MEVLLRISEMEDQFTQAEKKIAEYILNNPEEIYRYSIKDLATNSNTSPASIVRFTHKLGYDGFQEFKINLVRDMANSYEDKENIYFDITVEDDIQDIVNKVAAVNIKSIEDTEKLIDMDQLERAIASLNRAKSIYIFGVGASALVAMDLQHKLMRVGKMAFMYLDTHSQLASTVNIKEEDLAIGISHSGRTMEVLRSMEMAKKKGATTIALTKYEDNPLSNLVDIKLSVVDMEKNLRIGAIGSRIAQLTIIDMLLIGLSKDDYQRIAENILDTNLMVKSLKIK